MVIVTPRVGGICWAAGGGYGNIEPFRTALREVSGADGGEIWNFADVQETTANLRTAGFTDIDVRLVPGPARLERGEQLEAFIATVMLGAQLREMSIEDRRPFVHEVTPAPARTRDRLRPASDQRSARLRSRPPAGRLHCCDVGNPDARSVAERPTVQVVAPAAPSVVTVQPSLTGLNAFGLCVLLVAVALAGCFAGGSD
jgi:hypothetical protein